MAKRSKLSLVPYSVVAIVLVLGVATFIKLGTGNNSSDVLGMYTSSDKTSMSLKEKVGTFLRQGMDKKVTPQSRNLTQERKQRVSDWMKEIDKLADDGGTKEFQNLQKDLNSL